MTPVKSAAPARVAVEQVGVSRRARDVTRVSERLHFREEIHAPRSAVLGELVQFLRREGVGVRNEVRDGGEPERRALVVSEAELQSVELPIGAEVDHAAVVGERFRNAGSVHHQAADGLPGCRGRAGTGPELGTRDDSSEGAGGL